MNPKPSPDTARNYRAFWRGLLAGLAAPAFVLTPEPVHIPRVARAEHANPPARSPVEALRGDWERIGQDFAQVIACETARTPPKTPA
jgi:hypothetical protein